MNIKKMPLLDDLAHSINAIKGHLPTQTAKDLTGMVERSAKLSKLSKIGFAAMGICSLIALIFTGMAHLFAPSAGIAEFDVPRILIDSFSSTSEIRTEAISGSVSNMSGVLAEFFDGPVMKAFLLLAMIVAGMLAVFRQTLIPLMMVAAFGGSTVVLGPALNLASPDPGYDRTEPSTSEKSPRELFEIAIRDHDSATLQAMLKDSSPAGTYLKAQIAIRDETQAPSVIDLAAKSIASGDLGFAPNNQVAYAIEHSAGVKQLSAAARSYADPAIAKSDFFGFLSDLVVIATLVFAVPDIAVLLLHISIQRRIRRIGRVGLVLLG
ncbi:hypothetical protein [Pseudomonas sp. PS02290]|uniref:hypothetical protein n=1 Tax=Pseudomonas sp. PS02290 TaxID=2991430 RepID=UPI001A131F24|nr:hypothetical protein [Pseudomonas sp. PS02290]MBF9243228.1 hypothetical protein [Pseudomonas syringae pv. tomato]